MTCNEFIDFLIDYYDDNLPADRRQLFEAHLAACSSCVAYLDSYKKTVELLKDTANDSNRELDDDVPAGLIDAIVAARPE